MNNDKTIVIGIGNIHRGDDSLGHTVINQLKDIAGIVTAQHNGEPASLIDLWQSYNKAIIVDAVSSDNPAGHITSLNLHDTVLPDSFKQASTHGFGIAEAVELARVLGQLPDKIFFCGMEGKNFSVGEGISAELQDNLEKLIKHIRELINA